MNFYAKTLLLLQHGYNRWLSSPPEQPALFCSSQPAAASLLTTPRPPPPTMGQGLSSEQAALPFAFAAEAPVLVPRSQSAGPPSVHERDDRGGTDAVQSDESSTSIDVMVPDLDSGDKPIRFGQLTSLTTIGLCSQNLFRLSPNVGLLYATTTLQL